MSLPTRLSGILAVAGPTLTSSVTTLRAATLAPSVGVCLTTVPTVSPALPDTFSNRGMRSAFLSSASASAGVLPTTSGTATDCPADPNS